MPLSTLTIDELRALVRGNIRNLIPGADVSEFSDYDVLIRTLAVVFEGNQAHAAYVARQIFPATADAEYLTKHAEERGIPRLSATAATGKVQMRAGTTGATQAINSVLTHADGTAYTLTSAVTPHAIGFSGKTVGYGSTKTRIIVSPNTTGMLADRLVSIDAEVRAIREVLTAQSAIDLYEALSAFPLQGTDIDGAIGGVGTIAASSTGLATNKLVGEQLTPETVATPFSVGAGGDGYARLIEISGGGDIETDEALRTRLIDYDSRRPGSANAEQYREWARTTPGVTLADAIVYPNFRGMGTVDIVLLGPSGARITSDTVNEAVADYIAEKAPFTDDVLVKSMIVSGSSGGGVLILVTPARGYEPDFDQIYNVADAEGASTTTRLYLQGSPIVSPLGHIEPGDRIQIDVGTVDGMQYRTVSDVGPNYIDLTLALPAVPTNATNVRPGGPLVDPIREAIDNVVDNLGPGGTDAGPVTVYRHPETAVLWDDTLRPNKIIAAVLSVPGVLDVEVITPASSVVPSPQEVIIPGLLDIEWT